MKVTVTLPETEWRALLAALPRCHCGALAEVELNCRRACLPCAASVRRGRCRTLEHADAAGAIVEALSPHTPHTPPGKWTEEQGG